MNKSKHEIIDSLELKPLRAMMKRVVDMLQFGCAYEVSYDADTDCVKCEIREFCKKYGNQKELI